MADHTTTTQESGIDSIAMFLACARTHSPLLPLRLMRQPACLVLESYY